MTDHTTRSHRRKFSQEQIDEICRRYQLPKDNGEFPTLAEIDIELGYPSGTTRRIVRRNGIETRPNLPANWRRTLDEQTELAICAHYQSQDENRDWPTVNGLALEYGCGNSVIRTLLVAHGIEIRPTMARQAQCQFDRATEIAICEYYWTRLPTGFYPSHDEISAKFNCTDEQARAALRRQGYRFRTVAETRAGRSNKPVNLPPSAPPLCACGCGQPVKWIAKQSLWLKYVKGHYRPRKPYHKREWLFEEYVQKGRTVEDIAGEFDVTPTTIYKFVVKFGFEPWRIVEMGIERIANSTTDRSYRRYVRGWGGISRAIRVRDNWKCQLCHKCFGTIPGELHVHHIDDDKKNNHPRNLISLCKHCHGPIHGNEEIRPRLIEIAIKNSEAMPDGWVTWEIH